MSLTIFFGLMNIVLFNILIFVQKTTRITFCGRKKFTKKTTLN